MPLIETDAANPQSFGMGLFAPHADPKKFRSLWACVEGENDGRWPSVREAGEGIPVGNDGRKRLPFAEFKGQGGKPHDIHHGKVKLREMIVPIEDAEEKDRYEGMLSTREVQRFQHDQQNKREAIEGVSKTVELSSTIETHD